MRVSAYRDLMDEVQQQYDSAKSAANEAELDAECQRLGRKVKELEAAECLTAKTKDLVRSAQLQKAARQFCFSTLMAIHDNQRIEAEYLGT